MIHSTRILTTDSLHPHHNLAMEELLMRRLPPDQAVLFLWQSEHAVVIGAGQNAWRECHTDRLASEGGTLARRKSGGGAMYQDRGNLNFSFIMPREDYDVARQCRVILRAVETLGLNPIQSGRNDLEIDGRKFSGNAFRMMERAALHHGTLLVGTEREKIGRYLNASPEKLAGKGVRSVPARVVNLGDLCDVDVPRMCGAVMDAFRAEYGFAEEEAFDPGEDAEFLALRAKYADWNWVYGASPAGSVVLERRFDFGEVQVIAEVARGIAREVRAFTDSLDETLALRLTDALTGCEWRGDMLAARVRGIGEEEIAQWLEGV